MYRECFDCLELDSGDASVEGWRVRIVGKPIGQIWVQITQSRTKRQTRSLMMASPCLHGGFNALDIFWKYNPAERREFRRFLECVEVMFLTQLVRGQVGKAPAGRAVCEKDWYMLPWWEAILGTVTMEGESFGFLHQ